MDNMDRYVQTVSDIFLCYGMLQSCIGLAKVFSSQGKIEEALDCCKFADQAYTEIMKRTGNDLDYELGEDEVFIKY